MWKNVCACMSPGTLESMEVAIQISIVIKKGHPTTTPDPNSRMHMGPNTLLKKWYNFILVGLWGGYFSKNIDTVDISNWTSMSLSITTEIVCLIVL